MSNATFAALVTSSIIAIASSAAVFVIVSIQERRANRTRSAGTIKIDISSHIVATGKDSHITRHPTPIH